MGDKNKFNERCFQILSAKYIQVAENVPRIIFRRDHFSEYVVNSFEIRLNLIVLNIFAARCEFVANSSCEWWYLQFTGYSQGKYDWDGPTLFTLQAKENH